VLLNQTTWELARDCQERLIAEHTQVRLVEQRASIRESIGRRVIAVGRRIAGEPSLLVARSR
jgi:hypothetical protein